MARDGPGEAECVGKGTGEEVVEDCNKVSSEFPILQQSEVPIQLASFPHLELGATVYVFTYFSGPTRGVVQLFNAVEQHQKKLKAELEAAGPTEVQKEKRLAQCGEDLFLQVLNRQKVKSFL